MKIVALIVNEKLFWGHRECCEEGQSQGHQIGGTIIQREHDEKYMYQVNEPRCST